MTPPAVKVRPTSPVSTGGRRRSAPARRRARTGLLLTVPALVLVLCVVIGPIGFAIWISLHRWPLFGDVSYIGLGNYRNLLHDSDFWHSFAFTLLYTVVVTPPILVFGYLMAAFVRTNRRGTRVFRTIFFLPFVVGLTTLSFLLFVELRPDYGLVNVALRAVGLTDGQTAWSLHWVTGLLAVSAMVVWCTSGFSMLLIVGGMQSISTDIYEAALIDGATAWKREFQITLPLVRRNVAMALVLSVIGSFLAFQQFFIVTNGGPGTDTTTVVMAVVHKAFYSQQLGAATAMGLVVMIVVAALTTIELVLLRDRDE